MLVRWIVEKVSCFDYFFPMVIQLLHCTGGGAYAVIDKRSKGEADAQASSSDDGKTVLNMFKKKCIKYKFKAK